MLNQHFDHGLMQCMLTDPILEQSHCYQCVFHTLMLFHDATARGLLGVFDGAQARVLESEHMLVLARAWG